MVDWFISVTYGANGKVSPEGDVKVKDGADLTLKIDPNSGYIIDEVIVDGSLTLLPSNSYTFYNVKSAHTFYTTFKLGISTEHQITVIVGANGKVSPHVDVKVKNGANQEFKFDPAIGYDVDTVLLDGNPVTPTTAYSYILTNVTAPHTLSVTFKAGYIDTSRPVQAIDLVTTSTNETFNDLNVIVTVKSVGEGGFVTCARCGSTFGNIVYDEGTDNVKCLMCGWTSGAVGTGSDPLKEIHEKLKAAKPPKV